MTNRSNVASDEFWQTNDRLARIDPTLAKLFADIWTITESIKERISATLSDQSDCTTSVIH